MYIEKYWGGYIGGSDDSLTLIAYLAAKQKETLSLREIFHDFGPETLFGDFQNTDPPLAFADSEGWEMDIHCAISLVSDLAALLLECRVNGSVDLLELDDTLEPGPSGVRLQITAAPDEETQVSKILSDFAAEPTAFDIAAFLSEEELGEMAAVVEQLRRELFA